MNNKKTEILFKKESHGSYRSLLFDKRWKDFRQIILERDKNKCIVCHSNLNLHVHHKQYHFSELSRTFKKPWDYEEKYLVTFCKRCHDKGHVKFKVPVKNVK